MEFRRFSGETESFTEWVKATFERIASELNTRRENSDNNLFSMVNEYILKNYDKDVSLEQISKFIGFNSSYFSQLFKSKTGKSFVPFKMEIRVKKAIIISKKNP